MMKNQFILRGPSFCFHLSNSVFFLLKAFLFLEIACFFSEFLLLSLILQP
jgi:hypothetical protein